MNPKDELREEHGRIMKMLAVLQRFFATFADLEAAEAQDLGALMEFLMGKKLPGVTALETAVQTKKI